MISARGTRVIVFLKSVLTGLQVVAGASILGSLVGSRPAALFIICVAAVQASVDYYASRTVSEAVASAHSIVSRAEEVTTHANEAVQAMGVATRAMANQPQRK